MTDIQQLAETTLGRADRFSVRAELGRAAEILEDDETVAMIATGAWEGAGNSLIVATDRRLIALNQTGGLLGKKLHVQDVPYARVTSVRSDAGRVNGSLTLTVSGGDVSIGRILPTGRAAELAAFIRRSL